MDSVVENITGQQDRGETNLNTLLAGLTPKLHAKTFVFATMPLGPVPPGLLPIMTFREAEGLTLIAEQSQAKLYDLQSTFPCRMITIEMHSSLDAIGFLAAITTRLKDKGMGVNPVSGFYHDYLFIPLGREDEAVEELKKLAHESKAIEVGTTL